MKQMRSGLKEGNIEVLMTVFCDMAELDMGEFKGKSRKDKLPLYRYAFCYSLYSTNLFGTQRLGDMFNLNHSTIVSGFKVLDATIRPPRPEWRLKEIVERFSYFCKEYTKLIE